MSLYDDILGTGNVSPLEQRKKKEQDQIWADTMTARNSRKMVGGVDPALVNAEAPKITFDQFVSQANP